ncbi:MAG: tetratricopeptide repeat protein [Planctomycetes bacterium]|nr:tetratricopeptide repeat protein [Planctomycetota bacterium]
MSLSASPAPSPMPSSCESAPAISPEVFRLLQFARDLAAVGQTRQCRAIYQWASRKDPTGTARNEYGCFLCSIEDYDAAIAEFRTLLSQAWERRSEDAWSAVCHNLAVVSRAVGDVEAARSFQQQAIRAAAGRDEEPESVACDLAGRACDAILAGDYELAEQLLYRSLLLETLAGRLEGQAADWGNLGVLYRLIGQKESAERCFRRAYRLHRRLGDNRGAGLDLMHLGLLAAESGAIGRAIARLRASVRRLRRAGADRLAEEARGFLTTLLDDRCRFRLDPSRN